MIASLVLSLLATSLASATGALPLADAALKLPSAVRAELGNATFEMQNVAERSTCTVFPVTKDGYLLTALHCVRECLMAQNAGEQGSLVKLGLKDLFVVKNPGAVNVNCPELKIAALGAPLVKIVATGPALTVYDEDFFTHFGSFKAELTSRGWDRKANDFALLKVQVSRPLACLPMAQAKAGDALWAAGYPMIGNGSTPAVLSASAGKIYGRAEQSRYYQQQSTDAGRAFAKEQFSAPGLIYSDAANDWGQSGGPVVGEGGQVLGIVSGFTNFEDGDQEIRELAAPTVENVLQSLPKDLALTLTNANTACRP